jgi:hypothetical protein
MRNWRKKLLKMLEEVEKNCAAGDFCRESDLGFENFSFMKTDLPEQFLNVINKPRNQNGNKKTY